MKTAPGQGPRLKQMNAEAGARAMGTRYRPARRRSPAEAVRLVVQRRRPTPTDPLWSITGDPTEIREAARRVWEVWQQHLADGGRDDGRFEPLRKASAQTDEDMLRATNDV